jgi:predicted nuclease of predicted toxin-antitoxin system
MRKKLLLDENLPNPLKNDFSDEFEVSTVHDRGWASLKNGHLLAAMTEAGFDYLLTVDKNLRHQQNLDKFPIKLVVIRTFDNRYKLMKMLVPKIEEELKKMPSEARVWEIDLMDG